MAELAVRVLMLGKGWFPTELGGLDRYYRQLLEQLPEAHGVVVGPAEDSGANLTAVSHHSAPLPARLVAFSRAARRAGRDADLIDAHFALYALLPVLNRAARRKPLVVHFQGPWAEENVSAGDTSRWRRRARRRLERAVYSRAGLVITLTGAFRRVAVERYGVSPWKTTVLAPGVDLERFSVGDRSAARAQFALAPDAFVACCARRLVPRMGLDILIQAWAREMGSDPRARLLIAGDGELRGQLERDIAERSLGDSVRVLGRVSDDDLLALYRAADVNVVPSIAFEGFGLVVLEAAACGTASIVTDAGGLPEAIAGLGQDLTVPASDVDALAKRLDRASHGELPPREHTRNWAEARGWERVADAHRKLFSHVASSGSGTRNKLRVVYLEHVAQLSARELELLRLLAALDDVEAHVILAKEGPLVDRLLQAGISVQVLPMPDRTRRPREDSVRPGRLSVGAMSDTLMYALRLARRLRRLRPDIVHCNSLESGIYGAIAVRLFRIPMVLHLHDWVARDHLPRPAMLVMRTFLGHLPDVVVCDAEIPCLKPRSDNRAIVVPLGDPATLGQVRPAGRPARPVVVGMVGPLAPWNGQDVCLRAFAQAFGEGEQRALIVGAPLVGQEGAEYKESLHRLSEELGLASRVEFRGHREDLSEQLLEMDIFVDASTIREPLGHVIKGMFAHLPVVATDGGGLEMIITDGVDGLLHPPADIVALARLLARLGDDSELRARLGRAAARRARDFYPNSVAEQMMEVYELARKNKSQSRRRSRPVAR